MTVRLTMERKCCIVVPENTIIRQIKVQGNWIKINSDAALNSSTTTLAAVARDHRGDVVKGWSKHVKVCSPIQAKASAILWAVDLAIEEQWNLVCFEGDAKACFDPLSSLYLPLTGLLIPSSMISEILLIHFLIWSHTLSYFLNWLVFFRISWRFKR